MAFFGLFGPSEKEEQTREQIIALIRQAIKDGKITDEEKKHILSLSKAAAWSEAEINLKINDAIQEYYKKKAQLLINEAIKDGVITEDEKEKIYSFADSVALPRSIVNKEIKKTIVAYSRKRAEELVKEAVQDGKITKEERNKIYSMAEEGNIDRITIDCKIEDAINEYKRQRAEERRQARILFMEKYGSIIRWSIAAIIIPLLCFWGGSHIYDSYTNPTAPSELSVAPSPLFDVNHYVEGEITGIFKHKSMPKNAKLIITPYLDCDGSKFYGTPQVYVGASVMEKGILVTYDSETKYKQSFKIINPTYGKKNTIKLHYDAFVNGKVVQMEDTELEEVWSLKYLEQLKEERISTPRTMAIIFTFLSVIFIIGFILCIINGGLDTLIPILLAFIGIVITVSLAIYPFKQCSKIETEFENIRKQYDNAVQMQKIKAGDTILTCYDDYARYSLDLILNGEAAKAIDVCINGNMMNAYFNSLTTNIQKIYDKQGMDYICLAFSMIQYPSSGSYDLSDSCKKEWGKEYHYTSEINEKNNRAIETLCTYIRAQKKKEKLSELLEYLKGSEEKTKEIYKKYNQ